MHRNILSQRPSLKLKFKINKSTITSFQVLKMSIAELNEFSKKEQLQLVSTLSKTYLRNKKSLFRFFVESYVYILNMKFMEYLRFLKEMYYKQSSNK